MYIYQPLHRILFVILCRGCYILMYIYQPLHRILFSSWLVDPTLKRIQQENKSQMLLKVPVQVCFAETLLLRGYKIGPRLTDY